jgi:nitrogen regulatory protein P-II 1
MVEKVGDDFKLIVVIVKKNLSRRVIKACKRAGSEGGTVFSGRGTGTNENNHFLGITVEPEKDIILTLVPDELVDKVMSKIRAAARLDKPGTGVAFVINSKKICGIAHMLDQDF